MHTPTRSWTRKLAATVAALGIATSTAALSPAVGYAQIPEQYQGMDVSGPVSVPAGQTTTVDLGVPLGLNTSQNGWTVVSNGTTVSVTAPEGESSISLPVSYGGMSTTVTLISQPGSGDVTIDGETVPPEDLGGDTNEGGNADGGGESGGGEAGSGESGSADANGSDSSEGGEGTGDNSGEGTDSQGASNQYVAPRPERQPASPVNEDSAEVIELVGEMDGNVLRAKMSFRQAADVYNKFGGSDTEGLKLRYLDGEGQIIQGVQREINPTARTLTLTYPENETPDNPFIIQVVRSSDDVAIAVVKITSPGPITTSEGGEAEISQEALDASKEDTKYIIGAVAVVVVLIALIIGAIAAWRKKRKNRAGA